MPSLLYYLTILSVLYVDKYDTKDTIIMYKNTVRMFQKQHDQSYIVLMSTNRLVDF